MQPPRDIVVVGIDEETFTTLRQRWPFPRSMHARLIRRIAADRPQAIAYDVQFTEETTPAEDNALISAVADARGKVVLAASAVDNQGRTNVFGGDEVLREIGARAGSTGLPVDPGGVLRRFPYVRPRAEVAGCRNDGGCNVAPHRASGHRGRRCLDRLSRASGHDHNRSVLASAQWRNRVRVLCREDRCGRSDGSDAAGSSSHLGRTRRPDGRAGDRSERDQHCARRIPDDRCAPLSHDRSDRAVRIARNLAESEDPNAVCVPDRGSRRGVVRGRFAGRVSRGRRCSGRLPAGGSDRVGLRGTWSSLRRSRSTRRGRFD